MCAQVNDFDCCDHGDVMCDGNGECFALAEQRDELLAALKSLADYAEANERVGDDCLPSHLRHLVPADIADAINVARVVIALAEGK